MKDFMLRNDTKLLFRNDPTADLAELTAGKKVLFVYGGGSVKKNGCYDGAILKKWTAKSERWYNNKKRRETHGKHQVYRGI